MGKHITPKQKSHESTLENETSENRARSIYMNWPNDTWKEKPKQKKKTSNFQAKTEKHFNKNVTSNAGNDWKYKSNLKFKQMTYVCI